jgi:hypothetical protein
LQLQEVWLSEAGSVEVYYQKLSKIISEIIFAGFPVAEAKKVNVLLKGLPQCSEGDHINQVVLQNPQPKFDSVIHLIRAMSCN